MKKEIALHILLQNFVTEDQSVLRELCFKGSSEIRHNSPVEKWHVTNQNLFY
jgi:hypothetical protein